MIRAWALIPVAVSFISSATYAQAPSVELRLETRTLELGEAVEAQLICTNTGEPESPKGNAPDGLQVEILNPNPMSSSFTRIVNGRRSQKTTYTYQLRITALKVGSYTLGPMVVEGDGVSYQTDPIRITVHDTQTMSQPIGDRYMFAELTVEPTSLYVTESYEAILTFGIRKVEINGRMYNVNMLQNVLDARGSQLSVFANGKASRSERWLRDSSGNRHQYEVFRVPVRVRTEEPGSVQVGPVFLKALYPTQMRRGFFGGYEVSRHRREVARTDAVTIEVESPPDEGRPADYTGAIGRFGFEVEAKPTRVEQGQPITLVLSITGTPLEGVQGPDLRANPELASRFDYSSDELVGDMDGGRKVYRRAIFPKQVGEQTIPPISWSYFDPSQEQYITLQGNAIPIQVDPASEASTTITPFATSEPETSPSGLTLLSGGLSPNYMDPSRVLANQSFAITPAWIAVLIASPLTWLMVALTNRRRVKSQADPHGARRRRARRRAASRISQALRQKDPEKALHAMADAVTDYFADRFGLGSGTVTVAEVRDVLSGNGFDQETAGALIAFLEMCDASQYAPTQIAELTPADAAANIRRWIDQLERHSA